MRITSRLALAAMAASLIALPALGAGNSCPSHLDVGNSSRVGKRICFEFHNLSAHHEIFPRRRGSPEIHLFRDNAASLLNPNKVNSTHTLGHIWIDRRLVADDPNYIFAVHQPVGCTEELNMIGQAKGKCVFPNAWMQDYKAGVRWLRQGVQTLDAFPNCSEPNATNYRWTGKMKVESIAHAHRHLPGVTTRAQPFYIFGPDLFDTGAGGGQADSCIEGIQRVWQAWDFDDVPVFWDTDIERIVVPLATNWHNHPVWSRGWFTEVTLTNHASGSMTATVENPFTHADIWHSCGAPQNPGPKQDAFTVNPGQSITINPISLHVPSNKRVDVDTVFFIRMNPLLPGMAASASVKTFSSGTPMCP